MEAENWTHREIDNSSFATVRHHTPKLEKEPLDVIHYREKKQDTKHKGHKNRGIPYLEILRAFHKMYIASQTHNQPINTGCSHLGINFGHMRETAPIPC